MTTTLVLPSAITEALRTATKFDVETAGVLLARLVPSPNGDLRLLARELLWVPEGAYKRRESDALQITSDGYVPALAEAEATSTIPIWLHTHPGNGSSPWPSRHDEVVDRELSDLFRLRAASEFYAALIVSHQDGSLRFTGHLESDSHRLELDRIWMVGERLALAQNAQRPAQELPPLFDRNIRAFGGDVQRVLQGLRIAVVGCGGTGSSVAEQLVRLGVRDLALVDPDTLSDSNLTRVYGSTAADVGRPKVEVLADHLQRIAPDTRVNRYASMITVQATARVLSTVDFIFGCTDDNAGRLVLSRAASYLLTPVVDCGVLLTTSSTGEIDGIHGRVTVLFPGAACLVCRNRIDLPRAASELMTPEERLRRANEGYAPALLGIEPAVVPYTTMVGAAAVAELLERLIHYGPDPAPSELLLRLHDRELSGNRQLPNERHYCHPSAGKLGLGLTDPYLEQTWSA